MTKLEKARALRNDPEVHYNCAQSVLMPFALECGLAEETARNLCAHFGGGMRMGSVCGALSGALMALGALGGDDNARKMLVECFKTQNGCVECAQLLKKAAEEGEDRKTHCDRMVEQCVVLVDQLRNGQD